MEQISKLINDIIDREGRQYTNHPSDRGGPTKFGITLATLRKVRKNRLLTADAVKNLSEAEAFQIFYDRYAIAPGFLAIAEYSDPLCAKMVDAGVLSGPARAALWLQVSLNALNNRQHLYPDIEEDGQVGPSTIYALSMYCKKRETDVLERAVTVLQGAFFVEISRNREKNEDFVYGWLKQRVKL